jgi:hypothetical protein
MTTAVGGEHPGRWLGGLVGAMCSIAVAAFGWLVLGSSLDDEASLFGQESLVWVGLLGAPIGYLLGRALMPTARSGGWGTALLTGVGFGLAAPPLGAIEILALASTPIGGPGGLGSGGPAVMMFLPFALVFSYAAVIATVPAGLLWSVVVRALSPATLARLAAPRAIERLGARHVIAAAAAGWLLAAGLWTA